jgi:hypothetical protein
LEFKSRVSGKEDDAFLTEKAKFSWETCYVLHRNGKNILHKSKLNEINVKEFTLHTVKST